MQMHTAYYEGQAAHPVAASGRLGMALREQIANKDAQRYVRQVMEATSCDPTSLARQARLSPSTITGIMAPKPRTKTVRIATIEAIASASGIPFPKDLRPAGMGDRAMVPQVAGTFPRDVPVHALLSVPGKRLYFWNQVAGDYAPRPPGIALARKVFAFRMPDHTMAGWRRKNEMIYVDPSIDADDGDHGFVELANHQSPDSPSLYIVRRIVASRGAGVTLASWGMSPEETKMRDGEVIRAMRVIEWPELIFG